MQSSEEYIRLLSQQGKKKRLQDEKYSPKNLSGNERRVMDGGDHLNTYNAPTNPHRITGDVYPILVEIKAHLGVPRLMSGIWYILDQTIRSNLRYLLRG